MELVKNLKQSKLLKYVFLALTGSIILAISSKIKIPFYPVPMTMQTLIVLILSKSFSVVSKATKLPLSIIAIRSHISCASKR